MTEHPRCPNCGTELGDDGLCPACLLKLGMTGAVPKLSEAPAEQTETRSVRSAARRSRAVRWISVSMPALLLIGVSFALLRSGKKPAAAPVVRFTLPLDEDSEFALSPDGTQLMYTDSGMLWFRRLDSLAGHVLAGTEGARLPFWSPDSRYAGFFAQGKLKKIATSGGPAFLLCDAPAGRDGMWRTDGSILFSAAGLFRVSASGGTPRVLDRHAVERWPAMLPDNRHYLYSVMGSSPDPGIHVGALDSRTRKVLLPGVVSPAVYSQGYVLFVREGVLFAQRFDVHRLEMIGDVKRVRFTEHVDQVSASSNGVLAYRSGRSRVTQLTWFDRTGKAVATVGAPGEHNRFAISPDGMRAVVAPGLWIFDFGRGTNMRLTFDSLIAAGPVWSPDGSQIAFSAMSAGSGVPESGLYIARIGGVSKTEVLLKSKQVLSVDSWSPDGQFIAYTAKDFQGTNSLWSLRLGNNLAQVPIIKNTFNNRDAQFSPDGRWIAYVSDETGREEVYVQSFPIPGGKWQVSASGGRNPAWRRDGKELFFATPERDLMAVEIATTASEFRTNSPRPMLKMRGRGWYATSADGQRFLVAAPVEREHAGLNLLLNWTEELQK